MNERRFIKARVLSLHSGLDKWADGKGIRIDVAVTSPFSRANLMSLSPCEDYAAGHKHRKYDAGFDGKPYLFAAVVFETLGAINEEGAKVISQVARFASKKQNREFSSFCGRIWVRFSCNLQRSVSQAILNRMGGVPLVLEGDEKVPEVESRVTSELSTRLVRVDPQAFKVPPVIPDCPDQLSQKPEVYSTTSTHSTATFHTTAQAPATATTFTSAPDILTIITPTKHTPIAFRSGPLACVSSCVSSYPLLSSLA